MIDRFKILKPCPFCGGMAFLEHKENCKWQWYVYCSNCHALSSIYDTEKQAIKAWNRRARESE